MTELGGKVVLITGASRGIGEAAAYALGRTGASLMLLARDGTRVEHVAQQITRDGGTAAACACDVSDYPAMQRAADAAHRRFGRIDVLVNNAGVIEPIARVAEGDPAEWARSIQINLLGAYHAARAVLPAMIAAGGGTIINLSSGAAHLPLEGWSAYCAGKAAVAMLTRSIALEHTTQGIRVFGFQPGTTDTDMHVIIRASGVNPLSRKPRESLTPVAHPAAAIVYLCTPAADDLAGQEVSLGNEAFRARLNLE